MKNVPKRVSESTAKLTTGYIVSFAAFSFCALVFTKIAKDVFIDRETMPFDRGILLAINKISDPFLDAFMPVATDLGGVIGVGLLSILFVGMFVYKAEYRRATIIAVSVAGAAILNQILKAVFERQRPDLWTQLIHESSYSFPSSHAMASAALGFAIIACLWRSRWRWYGVGAGVTYILFVGFSRMYLGVHYPTDIMAGWVVSGAWVAIVTALLHTKAGHRAIQKKHEEE